MAIEYALHVFEPPLEEEDLKDFFSNTVGSVYFDPSRFRAMGWAEKADIKGRAREKVRAVPSVFVGRVSSSKSDDAYIPELIKFLSDSLDGGLRLVDDKLIEDVRTFTGGRMSHHGSGINPGAVVAFLEMHRGKQVFAVSW